MSRARPLYIRFWEKVEKTEGCWLWTANRNRQGYGRIRVQHPKRTDLNAHRVAWELTYGPIPDGNHVCHKCDNPPCVRPDHLFIGTRQDNADDMVRKGRSLHRYGEDAPKVKLTTKQVLAIRDVWDNAADRANLTLHIAAEYGVSKSCIEWIVRRRSWKHI